MFIHSIPLQGEILTHWRNYQVAAFGQITENVALRTKSGLVSHEKPDGMPRFG